METSETRDLIERYYRALTSADRDGMAALVADDCRWVLPASAPLGPFEGGQAILAELTGDLIRRTFDLGSPFELEVRSMLVDGDRAVVQQRLTATAKDTGKPYDNQYCWVYTCRDGKIVLMEEYTDTITAAEAFDW